MIQRLGVHTTNKKDLRNGNELSESSDRAQTRCTRQEI
jgi:hypothetical protein